MPTATPITVSDVDVAAIAFDHRGLVPAIVQDQASGQVLMLAWMNEESLRRTLGTGRTWFWSRSREELWCKGETSGDRQWVREAYYDCDADTVLLVVEQEGRGACHTGQRSCFHRPFGAENEAADGTAGGGGGAPPLGGRRGWGPARSGEAADGGEAADKHSAEAG